MKPCPCCGSESLHVFHEQARVPVNSVVLLRSREAALNFPVHRIALCFCRDCGFIFNEAFELPRVTYGDDYEETQGYSQTFQAFHETLARSLVDRHALHSRTLVEIGCGKGEFLSRLCELGNSSGIGFDPTYLPERNRSPAKDRIRFERTFFGRETESLDAAFVCCKMTLEHIPEPRALLSTLRDKIVGTSDPVFFFQVPDVRRVLDDMAFWDIYYEHCSYFSAGSLARVFRACGFGVSHVWHEFDEQYLMLEATVKNSDDRHHRIEETPTDLETHVNRFEERLAEFLVTWEEALAQLRKAGRRIVLWGGGSKAVAFLSALRTPSQILAAVDINPQKDATFLPALGHEVIAPQRLAAFRPDVVIVMNPIYRDEIATSLAEAGVEATLRQVDNPMECLHHA